MTPPKTPPASSKASAKIVAKRQPAPQAEEHPTAPASGLEKLLRPGLAQLAPSLDQITYRGAVPLKSFMGWVVLVILAAVLVGGLAAHLLVQNRTNQLVEETTARVAMQAQSRNALVGEWLKGIAKLADNIASADMVRLYVADTGKGAPQPAPEHAAPVTTEAQALQARTPYLTQWLGEFVKKNGFLGAQIVNMNGDVLLETGQRATVLTSVPLTQEIVRRGQNEFRPLKSTADGVVMDVIRPIRALAVKDEEGAPVGALMLRVPVGAALADLLGATPLDLPGERTALLQTVGASDKAEVVGRTSLAPLARSVSEMSPTMQNGGRAMLLKSLVDGRGVFAILSPLAGTPFMVLQEYVSANALGIMGVYKPAIYVIVTLLVVILVSLMLALTLHLMGQRNRTRVKLLGQTMEALVRVVESRDAFLSGHHAKVARLAVAVGNTMHMGVPERATLFYAAQLAAVGRLLVPRSVLTKTSRLSQVERKELEEHITQSINVLGDIDFDLPIVPIISQMYERMDGTGHPKGLQGVEIVPMARILGAADAYVALTSARAHRKAFTKQEALKALQGGAFDAEVVNAIKAVAR
jgi:hypothetical protein